MEFGHAFAIGTVMMVFTAAPAVCEGMAAQALNSFTSPPQRLGSAAVVDEHQKSVGTVQKVDTSPAGAVTGIEVRLSDGKTQHFAASDVAYEPDQNVIISSSSGQ